MGISAASSVSEAMKLCIFDLRRGQHEGQELDKILYFFPADLPFPTQLSVIGLSEGLITFTRIFSPEAPCEVIEAEMHSHVFYEAERDIWMVMVVEKSESEAIWRTAALRSVLKEVHSLFVMFHGSIRALLDREPSGGLTRTHLYYFIMDYLSDFLSGKKLHLPNFHDSLKERGMVQMLTIGREAALEVQSLVRVLESCAGCKQCYSLIMFQDLLVSTTLSPDDLINVFTYTVMRLTPNALSAGASSWSYLRKGSTTSNASASLSTSSNSVLDRYYNSRDTSPVGVRSYQVVRPLQHEKWSKGKDGLLVTDIWGTEVGSLSPSSPTIWLKQTEERMYLCAFQHKSLTIILLIPVTSVHNGEQGLSVVKQQILENASPKIFKVEEKLSRGWGGENAYHVSGYRYLLVDGDKYISRASPPGKVTTLTKDSLVAMSKLREEVDLEKSRAKCDGYCEKDQEICIRAKNGAWVISRLTRGKELYMVLEKANETLLYASEAVEKFSDRVKRVTKMTEKVAVGVLSGAVKVSGFFTRSLANTKAGKKFFSLLPGEMVLATLDGFSRICDAVEVAGKNVMSTSGTVTTEFVSHRYGEEAAKATSEGLDAAGHAFGTAWAAFKIRKALNPKSALKPSALAKSAAKAAATAAAADKKAKSSK